MSFPDPPADQPLYGPEPAPDIFRTTETHYQSAWPTQELSTAAWTPPPVIGKPRRRRKLLVLAVMVGLGAATTGVLAYRDIADSNSPSTIVGNYYAAVASGDAPEALAYAENPPSSPYLTSTVLKQQLALAPMRDVRVGTVAVHGDSATVDVSYHLAFADTTHDVSDQVALLRHGSSWRLAAVAAPIAVSPSTENADRVMLAGRPLRTTMRTDLFPGALPVTTDTDAIVVRGDPAVSLANAGAATELQVEVAVSPARRSQVITALTAALNKCLAANSTDVRCPLPSVDRPVPGSLHGSLVTPFSADSLYVTPADEGRGILQVSGEVQVKASWKAWNFNNIAVPDSETVAVKVKATTALDQPDTIYWTVP